MKKAVTVKDSDRGSKDTNMFTYYIEAVSIQNQDRGNKAEAETELLSETSSSCNGLLTFNMKDYHAIRVSLLFYKSVFFYFWISSFFNSQWFTWLNLDVVLVRLLIVLVHFFAETNSIRDRHIIWIHWHSIFVSH